MLKSIHPCPSSSKASSLLQATNHASFHALWQQSPGCSYHVLVTTIPVSKQSQLQLLGSSQLSNFPADHCPTSTLLQAQHGRISVSKDAKVSPIMSSITVPSFLNMEAISYLLLGLSYSVSPQRNFHASTLTQFPLVNLFHPALFLCLSNNDL